MFFLIIFYALFIKAEANESIASAFETWDFGNYNSHSYELLIVVVFAVLFIALVLLVVSLLFKKLYDWAEKFKRCDIEKKLRKNENWLLEKEDAQLQQVLVHAELIRMQGDSVPTMEILVEDEVESEPD